MNAARPRLACPHCGQAVSANPTGRWLQRFQCPHCKGVLQFDASANDRIEQGGYDGRPDEHREIGPHIEQRANQLDIAGRVAEAVSRDVESDCRRCSRSEIEVPHPNQARDSRRAADRLRRAAAPKPPTSAAPAGTSVAGSGVGAGSCN